jgi:hypothetical protein
VHFEEFAVGRCTIGSECYNFEIAGLKVFDAFPHDWEKNIAGKRCRNLDMRKIKAAK